MTAAALIETLRAHPKACGMLGITFDCSDVSPSVRGDLHLWIDQSDASHLVRVSRFHMWLSGASTAKADEMDLDPPVKCTQDGMTYWDSIDRRFPTRLHATFAAIEAALDKETTT